jgi:anhydromevalonate phosphate decarboxylase
MSFRGFINKLREASILRESYEPISPILEVAAQSMDDGPVLFHDVNGKKCCLNILSNRYLLAKALGINSIEIVPYLSNKDYIGQVKEVAHSPFQEIVSKPDLSKLPILTYFSDDGGPYITSSVVVTEYEEKVNACIHRLMVMGKDKLAARLVPGRHTHEIHQKALENGDDLPVAIAIGVDPIMLIAASTRVPQNMEFQYASSLLGSPVELVRLENGVSVPHAEIVLEGYLTAELAKEGPFVDITGTRDLVRKEPVIRLTKMMTREDFIYHGLIPAGGEHKMLMGVPYEPLIFKAVSKVASVKDVMLTEGGCCYFHAIIQIEKLTEEDAKRAIEAAFQAHGSLKHVIVVDTDIDIYDLRDIEYAIATRMRGDLDILMFRNVRGSTLDPTSIDGMTTKVGIDATASLEKPWKFQRVKTKMIRG